MAQVDPPVFRIPDNDAHGRISALFLGPKAENADRLLQYLTTLVDGQEKSRQSYFPEDAVCQALCSSSQENKHILRSTGFYYHSYQRIVGLQAKV